MASLLSILQASAGNLNTQQQVLATAGHNTANVNTPGYSRETANLQAAPGSLPLDPGGVQVLSITQTRDRFVESQLPATLGQSSFSKVQSDTLGSVQALDPTGAGSVPDALGNFYSSLHALSQNAGDPGLRTATIAAAQQLARAFNVGSQQLAAAQTGIDQQVGSNVGNVNSLARQVANLNLQIRTARASGSEPNDLLDERQYAQDQLSQLTGALPVLDAQGDVSLQLAGGQPIVSQDHAAQLQAVAGAGGHVKLQLIRPDGTGPEAVADTAVGGTIGGLLSARDGALTSAANSLDQLAFDLGNAINTVHAAGFALDHTTGHQLFTVSATPAGAAASLVVDPTVAANTNLLATGSSATAGPGDAANVLALSATERQTLSTGQAAADTFAAVIAQFGVSVQNAKDDSSHDSSLLTHLNSLRESASGVSTDEEVVKMQQAQRAYQAIGQVITTASSMFDTLLQIK